MTCGDTSLSHICIHIYVYIFKNIRIYKNIYINIYIHIQIYITWGDTSLSQTKEPPSKVTEKTGLDSVLESLMMMMMMMFSLKHYNMWVTEIYIHTNQAERHKRCEIYIHTDQPERHKYKIKSK
jgi:hypothetical protein